MIEFDNKKVISIKEKPTNPKSNYAITGLYLFDNQVIKYAKELKPSKRGETEISDLHNKYLSEKQLTYKIIKGYWEDAGTFQSLLKVNMLMGEKL